MCCKSFGAASPIMIAFCAHLCFQARYFFQQLISGVSYCHAMVRERNGLRSFFNFTDIHNFCGISPLLALVPYCHSKYATEI